MIVYRRHSKEGSRRLSKTKKLSCFGTTLVGIEVSGAKIINDDGLIEVIHFPKYSPRKNPEEHVWKHGRSHVTHNRFIDDIDIADRRVSFEHLNTTKFSYSILGFSPVL